MLASHRRTSRRETKLLRDIRDILLLVFWEEEWSPSRLLRWKKIMEEDVPTLMMFNDVERVAAYVIW